MNESKSRTQKQTALKRRLRIKLKKLVDSKRRTKGWNKQKVRDNSVPVMTTRSVRFNIVDQTQAT